MSSKGPLGHIDQNGKVQTSEVPWSFGGCVGISVFVPHNSITVVQGLADQFGRVVLGQLPDFLSDCVCGPCEDAFAPVEDSDSDAGQ